MLSPDDLRLPLPSNWDLLAACDTGTYMSAVVMAVSPDPYSVLVLAEVPNYRYVSNEIELLGMSIPEWAHEVFSTYQRFKPHTSRVPLWCDPNTQFRSELAHYGLHLLSNFRRLELRVEIAREYVQAKDPRRCYLAPWLKILPYELENAQWPDETTSAGKFERLKQSDHTLDCFEHCCSRRPRTRSLLKEHKETFIQKFLRENKWQKPDLGDAHLGRH